MSTHNLHTIMSVAIEEPLRFEKIDVTQRKHCWVETEASHARALSSSLSVLGLPARVVEFDDKTAL